MTYITEKMLYNLMQCPHRVTMDLFYEHQEEKKTNSFVKMLWEKELSHKDNIFEEKSKEKGAVNLDGLSDSEKETQTIDYMRKKAPLILGGLIRADQLEARPDILQCEDDGLYVAANIKAGMGRESGTGDIKKHYGVQLVLCMAILEKLGLASNKGTPFIEDINGETVLYDIDEKHGARKIWSLRSVYREFLSQAEKIIKKQEGTTPAYSTAVCSLCHWNEICMRQLREQDDLTLIPELGRAKRDAMIDEIPNRNALAKIDYQDFVTKGKTEFAGIGAATLRKLSQRAQLLANEESPYMRGKVDLLNERKELFFDIEVDPTRDFCYLHGFVERNNGNSEGEIYHHFFVEDGSKEEEERIFREAWNFVKNSIPSAIYYYSKYERTIWHKLRDKYPSVCSEQDIDDLFSSKNGFQSLDLYYDVVRKYGEFPTIDHSIKTLAKYFGFGWREEGASGASSIEKFDRWLEGKNPRLKEELLEYNEDDCRATRVLLDAIRELPINSEQ